jgi:Flp pilus assembly protein TadB
VDVREGFRAAPREGISKMTTTPLRRAVMAAALLVALVGVVDALRGGEPDLAVLFVLLGTALTWLVAEASTRRPLVGVRADLARWIDERSALTGEPAERIVDRAVADHRARLDGAPNEHQEPVG